MKENGRNDSPKETHIGCLLVILCPVAVSTQLRASNRSVNINTATLPSVKPLTATACLALKCRAEILVAAPCEADNPVPAGDFTLQTEKQQTQTHKMRKKHNV